MGLRRRHDCNLFKDRSGSVALRWVSVHNLPHTLSADRLITAWVSPSPPLTCLVLMGQPRAKSSSTHQAFPPAAATKMRSPGGKTASRRSSRSLSKSWVEANETQGPEAKITVFERITGSAQPLSICLSV